MKHCRIKTRLRCILSAAMVFCMLISYMPAIPSYAQTQSNAEKPVYIYINKDFEHQNIGDVPDGLYNAGGILSKQIKVVNAPTDKNPQNKAAVLIGSDGSDAYTRQIMYYVPAVRDFVVDMNFMVNDTETTKSAAIIHNVKTANDATYLKGGTTYSNFFTINDKLTVCGKTAYTGITENTWYNLKLLFKLGTNKIVVRVNDEDCGEYNMQQTVTAVSALRYNCPSVSGSNWYIDDYKSYISDKILSDSKYASDYDVYKQSGLMPPERYETGRTWRHNQFAFQALYGEFVMSVGGIRYWKYDRFYSLPSPLAEKEGRIIVPLRVFAESFGALVEWSPEGTLVTYNGTTLRFIENSDTYYVNGRPSKLYWPVTVENGVSYIQMDVLTNLFGVSYERKGELLLFTGELDFDFGLESSVMTTIESNLLFRYPTVEEIIEAFETQYPQNEHGRLLFTDWDEVRANMEREEEYKTNVERIIKLADSYLEAEPVVYETPDGLRGDFPQMILDRGRNLSFAYKVTNDMKYKERLWKEVEAISEFPDFNPGHQLDTGNSIHGMAYIYDWLYDDWDKETELPVIEDIFERIIYPHFDAGYKSATPFLYGGPSGYSNFTVGNSNQTVVINAGMLAAAIACFDKNPEKFADAVLTIMHAVSLPIMEYAPDGAWKEGGMYWVYTVNSLPVLINNIITGLGTDFDMCKAPGFMETAYFPISLSGGTTKSFMTGDDSGCGKVHGFQMFAARQSNDFALARFYKDNAKNKDIISLANYVFDDEIGDASFDLKKDYAFKEYINVTMKSGHDSTDTAVYFHGGSQEDSHGHKDTGTFLFDMLGERWTTQITHENYNLREYGSYENDGTYNDPLYRGTYYRDIGESKNMVIADYGNVKGCVAPEGRAELVKYVSEDTGAYAIMNLTTNNPIYECGVRGIMLDRTTGQIIVEDDYQAKEETDFWWLMSTDAEIDIASDGKSAILSLNNKRIWASILTDGDEKFEVLKSDYLAKLYPDRYGDAIVPPLYTAVNEPTKRLAIHNPSTDRFNVSVAFAPLIEGENLPSSVPQYKPMITWEIKEGTQAQKGTLKSVTVDGAPLPGFRPDRHSYTINTLTQNDPVPQIEVTASDEYEVQLMQTTEVPGITTAVLRRDGMVVGIYNFNISPLNDTTTFINEKQLPIQSYWATSEPQAENMACNLFDGDLGTKYATDEHAGSVTVDYGSVQTISEIRMAFTNGASRTENFMIEYSEDGYTWHTAREKGTNSGTTKELESYPMNNVRARYIRVSFYGNNKGSAWVSVAELCAFRE